MSDLVKNVTFDNFEDLVDTHPLVILDFWSEGCAPCRVFSPIFTQMAELHPDICFGKVNTETASDLASAFQIRSVPTVMAFHRGDLVFEQAGVPPPQVFEELIRRLRASISDASTSE